jgi:hypothetical protein
MDEKTIEPNARFEEIRNVLLQITAGIAAIGRRGVRLAAE